MSSLWRRFEVLLPHQFNDGREVPPGWLGDAVSEIFDQFGSASTETQIIEGVWRQDDVLYKDYLSRTFIDIPDAPANHEWMREYKERWRVRLDQIEIWMVSYAIEVE